MTNRDVTVELNSKVLGTITGFLTLSNGDQYDVCGSTVAELKADALTLAESLGVEIDVWNLEFPE
jgi:hypothetical protein